MREATMERPLSRAQLADLAMELRHECGRIERTLTPGAFSDELDELYQALQRIEDGEYGLCVGCGRRLPLGRVQVMPSTKTCVGCVR
jgi:RNA polymerase-binding transcription factor DksA